jgi:hypothetical protein
MPASHQSNSFKALFGATQIVNAVTIARYC